MKLREKAKELALEILNNATDNDICELLEELDSYNGYLSEEDRFYEMEMLNEFYSGKPAIEILQRAYYGHDNRHENEPFNPNNDYFRFNAYGNLVSCYEYDKIATYKEYINESLINELIGNRAELNADILADSELSELLDFIENNQE